MTAGMLILTQFLIFRQDYTRFLTGDKTSHGPPRLVFLVLCVVFDANI